MLFECLLGCSETYYRNMLTCMSDVESENLLNQWLFFYGHRRYIQNASNQILPKYTETGTHGIWQRKK